MFLIDMFLIKIKRVFLASSNDNKRFVDTQLPYWPSLRRPLMVLIFLKWRQRTSVKRAENSQFLAKQRR